MLNPIEILSRAGGNNDPTTQSPGLSGISGSTACNMQHLCCYLRRPLPLTPPQHKKHVNNLIIRAISAFESSPTSSISLQHSLKILDTVVTYANTHRLHSHEAKAQLWRGHVLLKLGYPAEASWCATRAFGWVEKDTGVEGRGQRWAASLKVDAERARAELRQGDERKVVRERFETVPGRESGIVASRRARNAERRERRANNPGAMNGNEKEFSQPPSHLSSSSAGKESPLSWRQRMPAMMHGEQEPTPPKSHFSDSSGGQPSPASIPYIGPKRVAIVHEEGIELWNVEGPRSSLVLGNKDSKRTLHIVNKSDWDPRSKWSIPKEDMKDENEGHTHHK